MVTSNGPLCSPVPQPLLPHRLPLDFSKQPPTDCYLPTPPFCMSDKAARKKGIHSRISKAPPTQTFTGSLVLPG